MSHKIDTSTKVYEPYFPLCTCKLTMRYALGEFEILHQFLPELYSIQSNHHHTHKGPHNRGNIIVETLLRKHCFLAAQTGKHLLKKQNVSEKNQKHFGFLRSKKCFRNKCFLSAQMGKHLGKQQCFLICGHLKAFI